MHQTITPGSTVAELQQRIAEVRSYLVDSIARCDASEKNMDADPMTNAWGQFVGYELREVLRLLDAGKDVSGE